MSQVKIYSASAGSGKTFNLVCEYISKLVENPYGYKHILAVTFTNKATNEMKSRILSVLYEISREKDSAKDYLSKIADRTNKTEAFVINSCKKILGDIIHNYSYFSIETIDSFLQRVLKNLTKEVGIGSKFDLLLDDKEYKEKAIQQLKEDSKEDEQLNFFIEKLIDKRTDDMKSWNYSKDMLEFSRDLNSKIIRENIKTDINREQIINSAEQEKAKYNKFVEELNQKVDKFLEDFSGVVFEKKGNCTTVDVKWRRGKPFSAFSKKEDLEVNSKLTFPSAEAQCRYEEVLEFFEKHREDAIEAKLKADSIYEFVLLKYIKEKKSDLLKEDNMFVLKETANLLSEMIKDNDVSFVYEKIGSKINDIMIDEFQDTSDLAWENFRFISNECCAKGGKSLIFGDIKQSIYRWNEGDWQILRSLIGDKNTEIKNLDENYRTYGNIVNFNNDFFTESFKKIKFENEKLIQNPEKEVEQKAKKGLGKGYMRFNFLNTKEDEEVIEKTIKEIELYKELGYNCSDIVLLFKSNSKLRKTADYLKDKGYIPISQEAFSFEKSKSIKLLIYALRIINSPTDNFSKFLLELNSCSEQVINNILKLRETKIPLIDLVDNIVKIFQEANLINCKDVFISAFYNELDKFCKEKPQNISVFLSYWNDFLKDSFIPINGTNDENDNKILLTTVHKSKGLEFPIVIIPFFDWKYKNINDMLWVENADKQSCINVFRASLSNLEKTKNYKQIAENEYKLQEIDTLNLIYVAFTRPKYALSTISARNRQGECNKTLSDFLTTYEGQIVKQVDNCFIIGEELRKEVKENEDKKELNIFEPKKTDITDSINIDFNSVNIEYALSREAKKYFEAKVSDEGEKKRLKGVVLHDICSMIYEEKDIEKVEDNEAKEIIKQMFVEAKDYNWFDGTYKVVTEKEIVENGKVKRLDRIMFKKDEVVIVDYKFSEDISNIKIYQEQINKYKDLISQMGYKNIKAYLWFVGNKIMEV